ncbi:MAG: beta-lactamase family protein [Cyclobacteriaceae bacterium]|nr:beta-lactamase family protein [Cyclobacteriaceae bacterium]
MKISAQTIVVLTLLIGCASQRLVITISPCTTEIYKNNAYSKADDINRALTKLTQSGVPGVTFAMYSSEGWFETSSGFVSLEDKLSMQSCHLQYLQSISKTYMAVALLKLHEQKKLDLNKSITTYLPEKYSRYISDAESITVNMLLNHTSGIPEYNSVPSYVTKLLQQPDYLFTPEDYLAYIEKKPLEFEPGSRYIYRNTNYVILALIADAITGDHAVFISENIFKPLGLHQTFYRNESNYLDYPNLTQTYWDRHSNNILENVSALQRNNVECLIGDDGIVATAHDAVKFLKGLMEGKLLQPETLELMKAWINNRNGKPEYGLGLDYAMLGGHEAWGHSGGGIGAGCQLYYFPEKGLYFFVGINLGTVTDSPIHKQAETALNELYKAMLD